MEPRLHAAFVAVYGHDLGRDATAEALAYAREHWKRVEKMTNQLVTRTGSARAESAGGRGLLSICPLTSPRSTSSLRVGTEGEIR
jgi:hypothetical protein